MIDQMGMGKVIFETDCITLKQVITRDEFDHAPPGALFRAHLVVGDDKPRAEDPQGGVSLLTSIPQTITGKISIAVWTPARREGGGEGRAGRGCQPH